MLEKIKRELNDPYICLGGDINKKDLSPAFRDFPEMKLLPDLRTRNEAALDLCYTNFNDEVFELNSHHPLDNGEGVVSDHLIVSYNFRVKRRHDCVVTSRMARKFDVLSMDAFKSRLVATDWTTINHPDPSMMVKTFNSIILSEYNHCFPEYMIKSRSSDLPWVTKRIKRLIRKKKRRYKTRGKDRVWKETEKVVTRELKLNRERHVDKVSGRIGDTGGSHAYHAAINIMKQKSAPPRWSPSSLFPYDSEVEVAECCAEYFNDISAEFTQIDPPIPPPSRLTPPEIYQVAGQLRCIKKSRSIVPGDIDRRVVNHTYDVLAIPLQKIFSRVFETCRWPEDWKKEQVTVIPKNSAPASLSETRNIACTPLFSKLLETFLLEELRKQVTLNDTQFGGIKGLGVDHFLIETWDEILGAVEAGGRVVNLMSIDFQKAFNQMDHSSCLRRLSEKGAHPHLIQLVGAFLHERKMSVRIGSATSSPRTVNGGAPQGSIIGPFLFCVVSEILAEGVSQVALPDPTTATPALADVTESNPEPTPGEESDDGTSSLDDWIDVNRQFNFFRQRRSNPLDDTVLSTTPTYENARLAPRAGDGPSAKAYADDFNIVEVVDADSGRRHITTGKTKILAHASACETIFEDLEEKASNLKMKIKKTQMLCINNNVNHDVTTFIQPSNERITSCDSLNFLGFVLHKVPNCGAQVRFLLGKFRAGLWSLRRLAKGGLRQPALLGHYVTSLCPILEYTSVTYHKMLTRQMAGELERAQSRALKIVYGKEESCARLLVHFNLSTLKERRGEAFKKFTLRASRNPRITDKWFPLKTPGQYPTRGREVYLEERAATDKLLNSPLFQMRKLLNNF